MSRAGRSKRAGRRGARIDPKAVVQRQLEAPQEPGVGEQEPGVGETGAAEAAASPAQSVSSGPERALEPGLHLLATPIGAARDLTLRGRDALAAADLLVAEDTRVLRRLMDLHGVALGGRRLIAYHEHNAQSALPQVMAALEAGQRVLYASDAGTPLIADPGYRLVGAARAAEIPVRALPGPCAAIAALSVSGLPSDRFCFLGFPPTKSAARRRAFAVWVDAPATLIAYESPHRLAESLADMLTVFGDRPAVIARELTKRFEEVRAAPLSALCAHVAEHGPPKGEIVVLIGAAVAAETDDATLDSALSAALETQSVREASRAVSDATGTPRKRVYERALVMSREISKNPEIGEE